VTDLVFPGIEPRGFEIGLPGSVLHLENKEKHYFISRLGHLVNTRPLV